jgi:hypothetical protein
LGKGVGVKVVGVVIFFGRRRSIRR